MPPPKQQSPSVLSGCFAYYVPFAVHLSNNLTQPRFEFRISIFEFSAFHYWGAYQIGEVYASRCQEQVPGISY